MGLPVVNQCCCGCDLKTGALIIAWIGIISDSISIGLFLFFFTVRIDDNDTYEKIKEIIGESTVLWTMEFMFICLDLMLYIMLSVGVNKLRPYYLKFWVTANLCYTFMCMVYLPVGATYENVNQNSRSVFSNIIGGLIGILIQIYFIIVVSSCRKEIETELRENLGNENTVYMLPSV